jgi:hypothetical protein
MRIITVAVILVLLRAVAFGQSSLGRSSSPPDIIFHESERVLLPDAPEPQPVVGFWSLRGTDDSAPPLRTNREAFHDRTWVVTQVAWLGTIVYDSELTHQGLAHHKCVEANGDNPHPSRAALYRSDIPEYAVGTAFNWMVLRFVGKPLIFEFPAYGGIEHIRGGSEWLLDCW